MECIVCNKPISKKARFCSDACRQKAYRNTKCNAPPSVTRENVTVESSVTDLELCRYCGRELPGLAKSRQWPGACYDCALKQTRRPSLDSLGELVYTGSERPKD